MDPQHGPNHGKASHHQYDHCVVPNVGWYMTPDSKAGADVSSPPASCHCAQCEHRAFGRSLDDHNLVMAQQNALSYGTLSQWKKHVRMEMVDIALKEANAILNDKPDKEKFDAKRARIRRKAEQRQQRIDAKHKRADAHGDTYAPRRDERAPREPQRAEIRPAHSRHRDRHVRWADAQPQPEPVKNTSELPARKGVTFSNARAQAERPERPTQDAHMRTIFPLRANVQSEERRSNHAGHGLREPEHPQNRSERRNDRRAGELNPVPKQQHLRGNRDAQAHEIQPHGTQDFKPVEGQRQMQPVRAGLRTHPKPNMVLAAGIVTRNKAGDVLLKPAKIARRSSVDLFPLPR